jgi:hypothetical protein
MIGKVRQKLEDWMAAAAFAEAGDDAAARELLGRARRKDQLARKRLRRTHRIELHASGPRG